MPRIEQTTPTGTRQSTSGDRLVAHFAAGATTCKEARNQAGHNRLPARSSPPPSKAMSC